MTAALLEDRHPLAVIEPENLELPFDGILDDVAGAGPENRSSVREDVEGCPGLSQLNRVPQCGHEAGSAERTRRVRCERAARSVSGS